MNGSKRLHRYLVPILLGIVLGYIGYFFVLSPDPIFPFSTDYTSFLSTGRIFLDGKLDQIYNFETQTNYQLDLIFPHNISVIPILNLRPPFFAFYVLPFALMDYYPGYMLWLVLTILFFSSSVHILSTLISSNKNDRKKNFLLIFIISLAFFPIFESFLLAQTVAFELFVLTLVLYLTSKHKDFLAGVVLGFIAYKPQLFLAFLILFIVLKRWRFLLGIFCLLVPVGLISLAVFKIDGYVTYFSVLSDISKISCENGFHFEGHQNWRGIFLDLLDPACGNLSFNASFTGNLANKLSNIFNLISASVTYILLWINRQKFFSHLNLFVVFACLAITSILASPHAFSYELIRLVLVLVLIQVIRNESPNLLPNWVNPALLSILFLIAGFLNLSSFIKPFHPLTLVLLFTQIGLWIGLSRMKRNPLEFSP